MNLNSALNNLILNTSFALLTRARPTTQGARLDTKGLGQDAIAASIAAGLEQFESENPGLLAKYGWGRV